MDKVKLDRNAFVHLYLFGLFALGLGLSHFLVQNRSGIRLTGPIRLSGQGLSVSLPTGEGWMTLNEWKYEQDNSYTLLGQYAVEPFALAEVRWQYLLAAEPMGAEDILQQQLDRLSMPYHPIARLSDEIDFVWAMLAPPEGQEEAAIGLTVLGPGRVLLLQVRAKNQPLMAEEMFRSLALSVQFQTTQAAQTGRQLAESAGQLDTAAARNLAERSFLISDVSGRKIGYSKTRSSAAEASDLAWKLQLETDFYLRQGRSVEQVRQQLYVDPFLDNLDWNCIYQNRQSRQALQYRLERLENGAIRQEDSSGASRVIWPADVTLPDTLVPMAASLLVESDSEEALVDVLSCCGEVVPTRLKKLPVDQAGAKAEDLHAAVRVDYLHRQDNYDEIYFDAGGQMIGKLEVLPGPHVRIWDRATEEEILFHFGNLFERPDQAARAPEAAGRLAAPVGSLY